MTLTNSTNGKVIVTVEIEATVGIVNADTTSSISGTTIEIARMTSLTETMTEKIVITAKNVN